MKDIELPIPSFYEPEKTASFWRVPYQQRAAEARNWRETHHLTPAATDRKRTCLLLIDVQNTFCLPDFELFVGGRSGTGAVDDNRRLASFIYRNLHRITHIIATMDTHTASQIFHDLFFINDKGEHPSPMTFITIDDIEKGVWKFNEALAPRLGITPEYGQQYVRHYTKALRAAGKYELTIWPFHAMLGGVGHALVSSIEEALFFHGIARSTAPEFQLKGNVSLTENYSALAPEVQNDAQGSLVARKNEALINTLLAFDRLIIAGQAKSHCVAWTISDLASEIEAYDPSLFEKVYLLDDCSSAVVIPEVVDFTAQAEQAYEQFSQMGMHRIRSTDPMNSWPGIG